MKEKDKKTEICIKIGTCSVFTMSKKTKRLGKI